MNKTIYLVIIVLFGICYISCEKGQKVNFKKRPLFKLYMMIQQ